MKHPEPAGLPRSQRVRTARPASERRALRLVSGDGEGRAAEPAASRPDFQADEPTPERSDEPARPRPSLNLLSLVAATFFVVSGGPYGLEEIVASHGYGRSLVLLCVVPLIWSLPIALLVGELGAALPKEGGYYAWVRRALGPFWGVQEAWLALAMSLFDMAIYPTLMVTYLGRIFPALGDLTPGGLGWLCGIAMIGLCALWNIRGSRAVGVGSVLMGAVLLLPFVALLVCALLGRGPQGLRASLDLLWVLPRTTEQPLGTSPLWMSGLLLCMWNYMGWDNASTVAAEVERPQRNYPRAMLLTILLVSSCYVIPVLCATVSGLSPEEWTTGTWVEVGRRLGGPWLSWAIALGGMLCGLGMFNVLVMSYSRLPMAMARDGMLPRWLRRRDPRSGAPTRIILIAAVLYAACMGLGFRHLVEIDVLLYGAVLTLEFVSLIVLRLREPELARPFRIRGGVLAIGLMAALPLSLIAVAMYAGRHEKALWGLGSLQLGGLIISGGPVLYLSQRLFAMSSFGRRAPEPGAELALEPALESDRDPELGEGADRGREPAAVLGDGRSPVSIEPEPEPRGPRSSLVPVR